jgi:hypothetical protein
MKIKDFKDWTWSQVEEWVKENPMLMLFLHPEYGPEMIKTHTRYGHEAAVAIICATCHMEHTSPEHTAKLAVKEYADLSDGSMLVRQLQTDTAWIGTTLPRTAQKWKVDVSELDRERKGGFLNVVLKMSADKLYRTGTTTESLAACAIFVFLKKGMENKQATCGRVAGS